VRRNKVTFMFLSSPFLYSPRLVMVVGGDMPQVGGEKRIPATPTLSPLISEGSLWM
jgi:hypothetical protein